MAQLKDAVYAGHIHKNTSYAMPFSSSEKKTPSDAVHFLGEGYWRPRW